MGVLVQREFMVAMDDRTEFERQSRVGVWERPIAVSGTSRSLGTGACRLRRADSGPRPRRPPM